MSLHEKTEAVSNIATVCVATLLSVVLVKLYLLPAQRVTAPVRPAAPTVASVAAGTSLKDKLPGVDWASNEKTLVLAISTTCHFCRESEPFYRRLRQELGGRMKIIAVLPPPTTEAEQYLKSADLRVDQVKELSLDRIGVRGTPTILLVDGKGVVTPSGWVNFRTRNRSVSWAH